MVTKLDQHEIIQILRRRVHLNQGEFGAKAFSTSFESGRTKVKNIELGRQRPTQKDLENMASVLGVPVTELRQADQAQGSEMDALPQDGIRLGQPLLDAFPGLEDYLKMIEKAVKINDTELIGHLAERISRLLVEKAAPADFARKATS